SQPVAHHVRSERNTVVVDFDKPSAKAAPYVLPPATRTLHAEAPDAMLALQEKPAPAPDPIAALGLDTAVGGPSASSVSSAPVSAMIQTTAPAARLAAVQPQAPPPAPTAGPGAQAEQTSPASRGRQFTGHPISLDFQGADLRAVLRTFAEI